MSEIYAKEYETYIISGDPESLSTWIPDSVEHRYITLVRKIIHEEFTDELKKQIQEFTKAHSFTTFRLECLSLMKELTKYPDKKDTVIKKIKEMFNIPPELPNYQKPETIAQAVDEKSCSSSDMNTHYPTTLDNTILLDISTAVKDTIYNPNYDPTNTNWNTVFASAVNLKPIKLNLLPDNVFKIELFEKSEYSVLLNIISDSIPLAELKDLKPKITYWIKSLKDAKDRKKKWNLVIRWLANISFTYEQYEYLFEVWSYEEELVFDPWINAMINLKKHSTPGETPQEQIKMLCEIKHWLNEKKFKFTMTQRKTIHDLLLLKSTVNEFDLGLFLEYLELPITNSEEIYSLTKTQITQINTNMRNESALSYEKQYISALPNISEEVFVQKFIFHFFFHENKPWDTFVKYFNKKYIIKIYLEAQLKLGKEIDSAETALSEQDVKRIVNETNLRFCDFNKTSFDINDTVEFMMEMKNISTLYVQVYEINTENYYLTQSKKIGRELSLEGIMPTYEDVYIYNDKPQMLFMRKITIDKIPKKRGFYIIEFISNGYSSRAIIQIGNLTCITHNTLDGVIIYIWNEKKEICKGTDCGIFLQQEYTPCVPETGAILVPYKSSHSSMNTIILKYENFCTWNPFCLPGENYTMDGLWWLNKGSVMMGNQCKCLVRPYIYINEEWGNISRVTSAKITVNLIKTENGENIPITLTFDNWQLSYEQEYEFQFQVPPKLTRIEMRWAIKLNKKSDDSTVELAITKEYDVVAPKQYNYYLTKEGEEYVLEVLGANGEAQKKHQINMTLYLNQLLVNPIAYTQIETDENGKVRLGSWKGVDSFFLENSQMTFNLYHGAINYRHKIAALEGDEIKIPFINKETLDLTPVGLVKVLPNQKAIVNMNNRISYEFSDKNKKYNYIKINSLKQGQYKLFFDTNIINIEVLSGKRLPEYQKYIVNDKEIKEISSENQQVSIKNITYDEASEQLKIELNSKCNNSRAHIYINKYINRLSKEEFLNKEFSKNKIWKWNNEKRFEFKPVANVFLNNKLLSEEIQYVLDRKQYQRNLGVSLEKPSLLLKPQFIRDTETETREAKAEKGYADCSEVMNDSCYANPEACYSRGQMDIDNKQNQIDKINFLNEAPFEATNLTPNDKGEIILKYKLDANCVVDIICMDDDSIYHDSFTIPHSVSDKPIKEVNKRDMRLKSFLNNDKMYCELRKVNYLYHENKSFKIRDITSIDYKIYDSISKIFSLYRTIISETHNRKFVNDVEEFSFLWQFAEWNLNEKIEKVSKYFSHELNVFLFFHFNTFFNEQIYPVLKYKIEKTFIDYFLWNDTEAIIKYTQPELWLGMNVFEKCLLIYAIRKTNPRLAKSIAERITAGCEEHMKIIKPQDIKKYFNVALNAKHKDEEEMKQPSVIIGCVGQCNRGKELFWGLTSTTMTGKLERCGIKKCMDALPKSYVQEITVKSKLGEQRGKVKEYCETHYYGEVYKNQYNKGLITSAPLFADLANYWATTPNAYLTKGFKSTNILFKPTTFTEFIFALSILDLEVSSKPQSHKFIPDKDNGLSLTIEVNSSTYLFTKELNETSESTSTKYKNNVIAAQIVVPRNRSNFDEDNKDDDNDNEEPKYYLTNTPYELKTVVTNISNTPLLCEILIQIPEGAIPYQCEEYTSIETFNINKFQSHLQSHSFYFPSPGTFTQYPSSVSVSDSVIARSATKKYEVLTSLKVSSDNIKNIDDVLAQGKKSDILDYISQCKIIKDNELEKVYWLLKDKSFYLSWVNILRKKLYFDYDIWQYGFYHGEMDIIKEYLSTSSNKHYLNNIGHFSDLSFVCVDNTNNAHLKNHKDYYPIINNRAHQLPQATSSILTVEFRKTYQNFISYLVTLEKVDDVLYMRLCYYLILQQRVEDAVKIYSRINSSAITDSSLQLQYDYITAYLDFSTGYPELTKAREICGKYQNFPLQTWKNMFAEINEQLREYDGIDQYDDIDDWITIEETGNSGNKKKLKDLQAKTDEYLSMEIKEKSISLVYKNISEINIKYYLINLEMLFSRTPFMDRDETSSTDFSLVVPNSVETKKLEKTILEKTATVNIPEEYANKNTYIEISSGSLVESEMYWASAMKSIVSESLGEIKVMDVNMKPLPKIYIKCFAKCADGKVVFYKDGYTDLRGRFNYVALNSNWINKVRRFAILITDTKLGSRIMKCKPPKIIIKESEKPQGVTYEKFQNYKQDLKMKQRMLNNNIQIKGE